MTYGIPSFHLLCDLSCPTITFPGKLNKSLDGTQHPEATGARELEEETHGLIPAVVSKAVLSECPQFYWKDGKMVLYFVRCTGGEQLPDMAAARLAGD